MESAFEKVLIEALDALESGEDVETVIARYPGHETELRPVLSTASSLAGIRVAHSLEAQAASRQRLLDYAAATAVASNRTPSLLVLLRRLSLVMASLLIIFGLLGTGALFASAETVPGDSLYDAKRFLEETRLSLTRDSAAREALQQGFEQERIREITTVLRLNRSEQVEFSGIVEAIEGDVWLVAGLEVVVLETTLVDGADSPAVGHFVQIIGRTANGRLTASSVMIRTIGALPQPTPEPDSAETPDAEPTPTATPTPAATHTPSPTPTAENTPTGEPTLTATPTAAPTLESNENGNDSEGNENENQGGGNSNENEEESNGNQSGNGSGGNENEGNENESNENGGGDDNNSNDDDDDDDEENGNGDNENRNDNEDRNDNDSS